MKPDYKNWMPKGSIVTALAVSFTALLLSIVFLLSEIIPPGILKNVLIIIFAVIAAAAAAVGVWMITLYRTFSYNGKTQLSKHIIESVADYATAPEGGKLLDVGCGSGALSIACAKRNPKTQIIGIDKWGKEYSSFNKKVCEDNARAEKVNNIIFLRGNALELDFPDETFDTVTSNYVYHNIPSRNRQAIIMESLRVLKKGGVFAIHDIFTKAKYGDMDKFIDELKKSGFERVELINTADGVFINKKTAARTALSGSALLTGIK